MITRDAGRGHEEGGPFSRARSCVVRRCASASRGRRGNAANRGTVALPRKDTSRGRRPRDCSRFNLKRAACSGRTIGLVVRRAPERTCPMATFRSRGPGSIGAAPDDRIRPDPSAAARPARGGGCRIKTGEVVPFNLTESRFGSRGTSGRVDLRSGERGGDPVAVELEQVVRGGDQPPFR